jgi:hypothetical protein
VTASNTFHQYSLVGREVNEIHKHVTLDEDFVTASITFNLHIAGASPDRASLNAPTLELLPEHDQTSPTTYTLSPLYQHPILERYYLQQNDGHENV